MKKKIMPVIIIIALILIIGGFYAAQIMLERFSYSKVTTDLREYYGITESDAAAIIYNDELIDTKAVLKDGKYYMSISAIDELISGRFYYGEADGAVFYTTPTQTFVSPVGQSTWSATSGESGDAGFVISYVEGEELYLALDYVKNFAGFTYQAFSDPSRVRIFVGEHTGDIATIKKKTAVRILGGRKSEVVSYVDGGIAVVTEKMDEWSRIVTWDAQIGYVENKYLTEQKDGVMISADEISASYQVGNVFEPNDAAGGVLPAPEGVNDYTSISFDKKINMGFHPIGGIAGNETVSSVLSQAKNLNVIAPTWIAINDNDGNIRSFATNDYITAAHANEVQVWAVVDDFNTENNIDITSILSRSSTRANIISQLMEQAATFGFDGINVDFEKISEEAGPQYLQFLRELSVECRKNQLVLSIDDYVPMDHNDHYDLVEQGVVADYVVIMGYDEHYAGSSEAGSVASIDYVQTGLEKALTQVPAEKLVNAIPFYTRVWMTSDGKLTSKAINMEGAKNIISSKNLEMNWDETTCQYYGEATDSDGVFYQLWDEEAKSIQTKLSVMQTMNIAGVAEWALGFETADIWDVIGEYLAQ